MGTLQVAVIFAVELFSWNMDDNHINFQSIQPKSGKIDGGFLKLSYFY